MNTKIGYAIVAIVVGAAAFFGGMKYSQAQTPSRGVRAAGAGGQFFTRSGNSGSPGNTQFSGTFGQIISKDSNSVTVKLQDGSSRIVLISSTTPVMKSVSGSLADLVVGDNVAVTGTANSDGSVTASQIQIRPVVSSSSPAR